MTLAKVFLSIYILVCLVPANCLASELVANVKGGLKDLSQLNVEQSEPVRLAGIWEFYPGALSSEIEHMIPLHINVPATWQEEQLTTAPYGFGTYRLQIEGLKSNTLYGFRLLDQVTSYNLIINGIVAASNGIVAKSKDSYEPNWNPTVGTFTSTGTGQAEFVMEIANFDYYRGGFWNPIIIGSPERIAETRLKQVYIDMFLFSSLFIMGIFFLGMYSVHPQDKGMIYFSFFCLCISFRVMLTGERIVDDIFPLVSWGIRVRLEYLFGYLLLPFLGLFTSHLFPTPRSRILNIFYFSFIILACATTLTLPHQLYASFLDTYKILALAFGIYFIILLLKMIQLKKSGSFCIFITFVAVLVALIKETFFQSEINYIPYAGFLFIISFSLVTMKKYFWVLQKNKILESKAGTDSLTGLFNRDFFLNYMDNYLFSASSSLQCSLLFLDLDSFKQINDTIGHDAGDIILKEVSHKLQSICRTSDIICRYGGDEFLIFLGDDDTSHATAVSARIIDALKQPFHLQGTPHYIGVSIGISYYNGGGSIEHMIKQGDHAMYLSKKRGGNTFTIFSNDAVGAFSI